MGEGASRGPGTRLGAIASGGPGEAGPVAIDDAGLQQPGLGERLRDVIIRERDEGSGVAVLVTGSVRPADMARATLALASAWVAEGKSVAIVDLFLGQGAFANPSAGEREEGVGDHLLFGSSWNVIERETVKPNLILICAGAGSGETGEELAGPGMKAFVAGLRERYDVAFLSGAIPTARDEPHPLLGWVDGWVGVVDEREPATSELTSSLGWVEVTRSAPPPADVAEGEAVGQKPAEAQPAQEPVLARVSGRGWVAALGVVAVIAVVVALRMWSGGQETMEELSRATPERVTLFPEPPEASQESVAVAPSPAVDVQEPRTEGPEAAVAFAVHVSSYRVRERAQAEVRSLELRGHRAEIVEADLGARGRWYRVWVGRLATREEAIDLARRLREDEGFEYARVVKRERQDALQE